MRIRLLAGLSGMILALAACGAPTTDAPASESLGTGNPPSAAVSTASIAISGFAFDPPTLEVEPGATVVWTNAEDAFHTVTAGTPDAPSGLFDSGEFDTGETFSFTFAEAGTYPFFCARHDFMRGEVVVGS